MRWRRPAGSRGDPSSFWCARAEPPDSRTALTDASVAPLKLSTSDGTGEAARACRDVPMLSATGARRRAWLPAALLPAGVLVVDPRGYAPFGPLRWAAVSVVALLAVAVAGRGVRHVARWPAVAWTAFVVWVAVCAALGVDPLYGWIGTAERHFGALHLGPVRPHVRVRPRPRRRRGRPARHGRGRGCHGRSGRVGGRPGAGLATGPPGRLLPLDRLAGFGRLPRRGLGARDADGAGSGPRPVVVAHRPHGRRRGSRPHRHGARRLRGARRVGRRRGRGGRCRIGAA